MVVPSFANSSAFSFPQIPVWAAIHLSSKVLVVPAPPTYFLAGVKFCIQVHATILVSRA